MTNDPMPWQLTVGELRRLLNEAPDEAIVGLALPPDTPRDDTLTLYLNVKATYSGGPVVQLRPVSRPSATAAATPSATASIAAAGNVAVPAILALESRGFTVTRETKGSQETWRARRDNVDAIGNAPLELLGLVALLEARGQDWKASDAEILSTLRRFNLDT